MSCVVSLRSAEDVLQEVTDKDISETLVKRIGEEKYKSTLGCELGADLMARRP